MQIDVGASGMQTLARNVARIVLVGCEFQLTAAAALLSLSNSAPSSD